MASQWLAMDDNRKAATIARVGASDAQKEAQAAYEANSGTMGKAALDAFARAMTSGGQFMTTGNAHFDAGGARVGHGDGMKAAGDAAYNATPPDYPEAALCYDNWGSLNRPTLGAYQHYWYATNDYDSARQCYQSAKYDFEQAKLLATP